MYSTSIVNRSLFSCLVVVGILIPHSVKASGIKTGPILGFISHNQVTIWARSNGGGTLKAEVSEKPDFKIKLSSKEVPFNKSADNTATVIIGGLKPATLYFWRVSNKGLAYKPPINVPMTFKTYPIPGAKSKLRIGIGSCNSHTKYPNSPIWNAVFKEKPDTFLWLGDNIYADKQVPFVVSNLYQGMRSQSTLLPVNLTIPQMATWDDHDFGDNDHDRTLPIKDRFLKHFKDWWSNPSFGEKDNPGVYFKFAAGPAEIFMLDIRYHRAPNSDPDGPNKTMLGDKQEAWLKKELKASKAQFKILASGTAWNDNQMFIDNWKSHQVARDRLFDYIRDEKISGVILISGDTHVGELNVIPRKAQGGYDLYEFVASPLANNNDPAEEYMKSAASRVRPVMGTGFNFGLIEIDSTGPNPTVSFELIRPDSSRVWKKFTVGLDELQNGKGDWKSKVADM